MSNPKPTPYPKSHHADDCKCRPCKGKRGENKEAHSIKIEASLWASLKTLAQGEGRKLIACLEEAVREYLQRRLP